MKFIFRFLLQIKYFVIMPNLYNFVDKKRNENLYNLMENPKVSENKLLSKFIFISQKRRIFQKWTRDEDNKLLSITSSMSKITNWKEISQHFINRTPVQCSSRYKRIRPGIVRGSWSSQEDQMLISFVEQFGKNWGKISQYIKNRNCKQIRDRYLNCLDKNIVKEKFSHEDDMRIMEYYKIYGPIWSRISKEFKGRTGDMIKNRFYSLLRQKTVTTISTQKSLESINEISSETRPEKSSLESIISNFNFEIKNQTINEDTEIKLDHIRIHGNEYCLFLKNFEELVLDSLLNVKIPQYQFDPEDLISKINLYINIYKVFNDNCMNLNLYCKVKC